MRPHCLFLRHLLVGRVLVRASVLAKVVVRLVVPRIVIRLADDLIVLIALLGPFQLDSLEDFYLGEQKVVFLLCSAHLVVKVIQLRELIVITVIVAIVVPTSLVIVSFAERLRLLLV